MQDYQLIAIIGANIAMFLSFFGTAVALIVHMNKRIDSMYETKPLRKKKGEKNA